MHAAFATGLGLQLQLQLVPVFLASSVGSPDRCRGNNDITSSLSLFTIIQIY